MEPVVKKKNNYETDHDFAKEFLYGNFSFIKLNLNFCFLTLRLFMYIFSVLLNMLFILKKAQRNFN
ncbi:hypothetical protein KUTeg_002384 [Tegillarca granosa]|uniref:Uncharacterized protein n=1 Tax=Tegillarca granosa TaxID=220873 RepID=A0ABQ9FU61_TEGGR|nr:hypothetical protein KUTeg_002384 [Tegillarca granosa]